MSTITLLKENSETDKQTTEDYKCITLTIKSWCSQEYIYQVLLTHAIPLECVNAVCSTRDLILSRYSYMESEKSKIHTTGTC